MMLPTVYDFLLTLTADGEQFRVSSSCPGLAGEVTEPHSVPADVLDRITNRAVELQWHNSDGDLYGRVAAKDRAGGAQQPDSTAEAAGGASRMSKSRWGTFGEAAELGYELYNAVFGPHHHQSFQQALHAARHERATLRLLIQYPPTAVAAHETPWELLCDGRTGFLAVCPDTLLARYLLQPRAQGRLRVDGRVRVLCSTACPKGEEPLEVEREARDIEAVARATLREDDEWYWYPLAKTSRDFLLQALVRAEVRETPFHVWHHASHGEVERGTGKFHLLLEDRDGTRQEVPATDLAHAIRQECPDLRVAVLNVCSSGSFRGLATSLAELNIPAVVGHAVKVPDDSALVFSRALYARLFHWPVDWAVRKARRALFLRGRLDWAWTLLFLRTRDGTLLAPHSQETVDD